MFAFSDVVLVFGAEPCVSKCVPLVRESVDGRLYVLRTDFGGVVINCGFAVWDVLDHGVRRNVTKHMADFVKTADADVGVSRLDGLDGCRRQDLMLADLILRPTPLLQTGHDVSSVRKRHKQIAPSFFFNYTTSVCIFQDVCTENRQICIVKDTEKGVFCTEKDGGFSKKDTYFLRVLGIGRPIFAYFPPYCLYTVYTTVYSTVYIRNVVISIGVGYI